MDRLACVEFPALPLQLLLQRRPSWADEPVVVLAEEAPLAPILWANALATRCRIVPGMTYAQGLSRGAHLRAGVVASHTIDEMRTVLTSRLRAYTPHVEPGTEPGTFWLDASGLSPLYASLNAWAQAISDEVHRTQLNAVIVVGFTRFGTYALARSRSGVHVMTSPDAEQALSHRVSLAQLGLSPRLRDTLAPLGVKTVGEFIRLPAQGLHERFGDEVYALHQSATNTAWAPLVPEPERRSVSAQIEFDDPESDWTRLLFLVKAPLDGMLRELAQRKDAIRALDVTLHLDNHTHTQMTLQPAAPTLDAVQLLDLFRLRLEALVLSAPLISLELCAQSVRATDEQLPLFKAHAKRDMDAGHRALARLRAELGPDAVVRAVIIERHVPDAAFTFEPVTQVMIPRPPSLLNASYPLVRRVFTQPKVLLSQSRSENAAWRVDGRDVGPCESLMGPYRISGAWWHREVMRDYYVAQMSSGALLWVYLDRRNQTWRLQGLVE